MSKKGRTAEKSSSVLEVGGLTLGLDRRLITGDNGAHRLTPMECRLLKTLMTYSGKVMSRKFLMRKVWETDYNPWYIKTVRGTGYRFGEGGGDNSERGLD